MKTSVVQLETHDDYLSVRDRLNWIKGGRVLLVWPKRARSLERRLDLVLLQHYTASLGLQLGLVTKDPDVRFHAQELRIAAFDSLRQAQTERWSRRRRPIFRQKPRPNLSLFRQQHTPTVSQPNEPASGLFRIARSALFALAILAVLAVALLLIPQAHVTLTPETRTQALTLDVSASPSAQAITLAGELPARPVSVILEGSDTLAVTGVITVPATYASGKVRFTNLGSTPLALPAGSVVSTLDTPPIRFATREKTEIPAGPGTSITLSTDALTAGTAGNVGAGQIVTLEGPLSFQVAVTNVASTRGGSNALAPAPSPADYEQLYTQLTDQLQRSATEALQVTLLPGDQLVAPAVLTDTVEIAYEPSIAQSADQLVLTLRLQFVGLAVSGSELKLWAEAVLNVNLPDGYTPIAGSLEISQLTSPSLEAGFPAQWQIEARRTIQAQINPAQATGLMRWRAVSQASQALASLPLANSPTIQLSPAWWPFIPLRVEVTTP